MKNIDKIRKNYAWKKVATEYFVRSDETQIMQ